MADINLFKIEGKPLEKLIDVISKGIGKIYQPKAIRNEADAEAYKIKTIEKAKTEAYLDSKEDQIEFFERIENRILFKEIKKQNNLDSINSIAVEEFKNEQYVTDDPVDETWIDKFFAIAEEISNEEMQILWGKILAGEVKQPQSYSIRTLDILRNISKIEASIFQKISFLTIEAGGSSFVLNPENGEYLKKEYDISYNDRLLLEEAGLITANDLTYQLKQVNTSTRNPFTFGDTIVLVERAKDVNVQSLPILVFTKAAFELSKLMPHSPDFKYIEKFAELLKLENVNISYAKIIEKIGTQIKHMPLVEIK